MPIAKQYTGTTTPANKQKGKKICSCCHEEKKMTDFYLDYSPMFSLDQRTPMCKECCKKSSLNEDGTVNVDKLKEILMRCDKPFYLDDLSAAKQSVKKENSFISDDEVELHGYDILTKYFTLNGARQNRAKSFADSQAENFMHTNSNRTVAEKKEIIDKFTDSEKQEEKEKVVRKRHNTNFEVTDEIIDTFGEGYTPSEYRNMAKKYEEMTKTYVVQTSLHKEGLLTYVRFKVKEEMATAKGDVQEAQKWYQAAQDAAEKAKLTPRQLSKEDLQGGIANFSDIFSMVEGAKERISIFPEFKYRPKDACDFIIWNYINYERELNNMPPVSYKDIYKFYDKKKNEYIESTGDPYGIFMNDPTDENRETIEKFIILPKDMEE